MLNLTRCNWQKDPTGGRGIQQIRPIKVIGGVLSASICRTGIMADGPPTLLGTRQVRQVYLITYSQAQEEIVPTRQVFADIVLDAFRFLNNPAPVCTQNKF